MVDVVMEHPAFAAMPGEENEVAFFRRMLFEVPDFAFTESIRVGQNKTFRTWDELTFLLPSSTHH
jgi:hypothetical protein